MYNNVIIPRQWSRLACLCRSVSTLQGQKLPQSSTSSDGISPPLRIQRSPTDILRALAATVGPDPTAAHFKYHDDPYLIPLSNYRKRAYALSAEAGRKAAVWVRDEHADLFTLREWDPPGKMKTPHFNADPHIDAFGPRPIYNDESKVTEEDLKYTIENALLEDSIKIFQLLGGTESVNDQLKMAFLQLLCFCNEKEPDSAEWLEERWFSASSRERQAATWSSNDKELIVVTGGTFIYGNSDIRAGWRLGGLADKIFASLEPKTPEAYCAIIQGMAKYYQAERAHMLSQEALEKGFPLSTEVYNSLLGCVGFLKEGTALRIDALKNLLNQMNEQGLSPNHETLTACLRSISVWGGGKTLQQVALQIVAEFRQIGIEPGLSAYYYLLCLFCKERGPRFDILSTILNDLEKREDLEPREATDTNFFITAMGVCSDHLQDINMAERVHALLMKGDNYKLVGDAYKESIYYRHYVTVACRHAPFEKTTQLLDVLIPNVYVPEPSVMEEIIKTLEVGGAGDRLAQAWSQLVIFGHARRVRLVEKLLAAMTSCYEYQDEDVKAKMRSAASEVLKFGQTAEELEEAKDLRTPTNLKLSANALSIIIQLCSDAKDKEDPCWETVTEALKRLRKEEAAGVPTDPQTLADVATKAATIGKQDVASMAVAYLAECGFEEALSASVATLGAMLNRNPAEIQTLLEQPPTEIAASLHPAAMAVFEAYQMAKTGAPVRGAGSSTSSSGSDSDSSSSDDE